MAVSTSQIFPALCPFYWADDISHQLLAFRKTRVIIIEGSEYRRIPLSNSVIFVKWEREGSRWTKNSTRSAIKICINRPIINSSSCDLLGLGETNFINSDPRALQLACQPIQALEATPPGSRSLGLHDGPCKSRDNWILWSILYRHATCYLPAWHLCSHPSVPWCEQEM